MSDAREPHVFDLMPVIGQSQSDRVLFDEVYDISRTVADGYTNQIRKVTGDNGKVTRISGYAEDSMATDTRLKYDKTNQLMEYTIADHTGKVVENGKRTGNGWEIAHFSPEGKKSIYNGMKITRVELTERGHLERWDLNNINHRVDLSNNNRLRIDSEQRVLAEWTPDRQRRTEYKYSGMDLQPMSFHVRDSLGKTLEIGSRDTQKQQWQYKLQIGSYTAHKALPAVLLDQQTGRRFQREKDSTVNWLSLDGNTEYRYHHERYHPREFGSSRFGLRVRDLFPADLAKNGHGDGRPTPRPAPRDRIFPPNTFRDGIGQDAMPADQRPSAIVPCDGQAPVDSGPRYQKDDPYRRQQGPYNDRTDWQRPLPPNRRHDNLPVEIRPEQHSIEANRVSDRVYGEQVRQFESTGNPVLDGQNLCNLLESGSLKPGTTLVLPPGRITMPPTEMQIRGGTPERPIRIMGSREGTIISGGNRRATMKIVDSSNFSLENLKFDTAANNPRNHLLIIDAENVKIAKCSFSATSGQGSDSSTVDFGGRNKNISIQRNYIDVKEPRLGHGIYIGEGSSTNVLIEGNQIHHWGDGNGAMIQINANNKGRHRNVIIRDNQLLSENRQEPGGATISHEADGRGGGIALSGVDGVDIYRNRIFLRRSAQGRGGALIECWGQQITDAKIHNNYFDYDSPKGLGREPIVNQNHAELAMWQNHAGPALARRTPGE